MAIQSYSWRYDIAKHQIFLWLSDTFCKDVLLTKVENPAKGIADDV